MAESDCPGDDPGVFASGWPGARAAATSRNGSRSDRLGQTFSVGERRGDAVGQVLDADPLGGVVAGGDQGDAERLGLEAAVESRLAGEQDVRPGTGGVLEEVVAGPAARPRRRTIGRRGSPTICTA